MKRLFLAAAMLSLLATNSWGTTNYNSSKSNIYKEFPSAELTSAFIDLSGPGDSETVYTTPAKGDFMLTQFCASPDAVGGVRLDSSLGGIVQTASGVSCYTFTPGVSIPKGSALTCSIPATTVSSIASSSPSFFCMISGMQTAN